MNNNLKDRAKRKDFGLTPKECGLVINHIKEVAQSQPTPIKDILEQNIDAIMEAVEITKKAITREPSYPPHSVTIPPPKGDRVVTLQEES